MKRCNRCKKEKQLSEFHKNKRMDDGLNPECKTCKAKRGKERYKKVGHIMRQQMADQRKRDYEHRIEIERRSREKHRARYRPMKAAQQQVRYRLKNNNKYRILEKELRRLYHNPCHICGSREDQSVDHIIPLSKGGRHSIGNMMTLCRSCNASKSNNYLFEWKLKKTKHHINHYGALLLSK
jgi:5-methylcytosine-specific restriction endonuclease McrA